MSENPLIVKCASCGSNAQYNIKEQSYCCPACGGKTSALDPVNHLNNWRHEHQNKIKEELRGLPHSVAKCPNCSAEFFFKENEFESRIEFGAVFFASIIAGTTLVPLLSGLFGGGN